MIRNGKVGMRDLEFVAERIHESNSPVLLLGGGARQLTQHELDYLASLGIPICLTWSGAALASKILNYVGIVGQFGRPVANRTLHGSDFVLALGCRLPITVTGQNIEKLKNKIVLCDIDSSELMLSKKRLSTKNLKIDVSSFVKRLSEITPKLTGLNLDNWLKSAAHNFELENNFLISGIRETLTESNSINSHFAFANLTKDIQPKDYLVIDGGGTALYTGYQAAPFERFAGVAALNAISSMGTAPAQMSGVLNAKPDSLVIGVIGDGSYVMALNALPNIASNKNAVLIIISNRGYLAIRHTQQRFLDSRFDGTWLTPENSLPSIENITIALGMNYVRYRPPYSSVHEILSDLNGRKDKATVIEVETDPAQPPFWGVKSYLDEKGRLTSLPLFEMSHMGL